MFRINLYPERETRRREAKLQFWSAVLLTATAGLGFALLALVLVNGFLLRERARDLEENIARLESQTQATPAADPDRQTGLAIARARAARIDWSPKLAAVAKSIGDNLRLNGLNAHVASKGRGPQLELQGSIRGSREDLEPVSRFLDSLRADPRITSVLPSIRLGTLEGSGSGRFQILCETAQEAS